VTAIDTSRWTLFGRSDNAEFFEIEPLVLAVVPVVGCDDTEETARQSIRIQLEHLRKRDRGAGVLVFVDRVVTQSPGARRVYRDEPDPAYQACFALVGGTRLGRAVGSVFLGLQPPRVPTRLFATEADALAWARQAATDLARGARAR